MQVLHRLLIIVSIIQVLHIFCICILPLYRFYTDLVATILCIFSIMQVFTQTSWRQSCTFSALYRFYTYFVATILCIFSIMQVLHRLCGDNPVHYAGFYTDFVATILFIFSSIQVLHRLLIIFSIIQILHIVCGDNPVHFQHYTGFDTDLVATILCIFSIIQVFTQNLWRQSCAFSALYKF